MAILKFQQKIPLKYFIYALIVILTGTLFFGLRPKGYSYSNNVEWVGDSAGIRFGQYGIAYTDPIQEFNKEAGSGADEFSLEIALKPLNFDQGFNLILAFHDGKDSDQLILGQWRSYYILMNGDDYDHKRKTKRISVKANLPSPSLQFVTITTGKEGANIYIDGQLVVTKKNIGFKLPSGNKTILILGNSVYGRHSWLGEIDGFAFYDFKLTESDVSEHYSLWSKKHDFKFAVKDNPQILYLFDENRGLQAIDHSMGGHNLKIPGKFSLLEQDTLSLDWKLSDFDLKSFQDIIFNFIGFMPLGLLLSATFIKAGYSNQFKVVLITAFLCFVVSLTIEIIQAWIPSRSSDSLDLMLNTIGGFAGALFYCQVIGKRMKIVD